MKPRFYITTPIYYVNARPHLGHAYTTIVADALARFQRLLGREAWFLTGTDEHGDKIVQAAEAEGVRPREFADRISALFQETWPRLDISNDDFIRTTQRRHVKVVQAILKRVHDNGDIYFDKYGGLYCFGCERFYTEKELTSDLCPDHQKPLTYIEEENYFFRMSKYQDWLIKHIQDHPDFIRPERFRHEVLSFLKEPLEDLCLSRPKSRLTWGIDLPFDYRFVTYVWFDALINYVSALGYPDGELFRRFWPAAQHLIAKDILKPHAVYWPTMLKAAGLEPYRHLNVHGYWRVGGGKMSKSLGNVVEALQLKDVYGLDAFRYFLLRDMVFGLDSDFSEEALVGRINADLANDLGNLCQRSLTMVKKMAGGRTPPRPEAGRQDGFLPQAWEETRLEYIREFENLAFHKALIAVWRLINQANLHIVRQAPWELARDPKKKDKLDEVLYQLLKTLALVAGMIHPVMPRTSAEMLRQLGLPPDRPMLDLDEIDQVLVPGAALGQPQALFPRVEMGGAPAETKAAVKETALTKPEEEKKPAEAPAEGIIGFEDFKKMDLRVGLVKAAARVPKSDKLIKMTVDIGEERTVVAGIGLAYQPEDLVGRRIIVLANLAPRKMMGEISQGMMLAATDADGLAVLTLDRPAAPGAKVS
ncbi:MAG: methionine--tRNA ligase [Thermodesulfobacteriota bacterium]